LVVHARWIRTAPIARALRGLAGAALGAIDLAGIDEAGGIALVIHAIGVGAHPVASLLSDCVAILWLRNTTRWTYFVLSENHFSVVYALSIRALPVTGIGF
jgi:hypothetical protein